MLKFCQVWVKNSACEIPNEFEFIFFTMTLFVILWSGSWMVNALACHHGDEGFNPSCGMVSWLKAYKWFSYIKKAYEWPSCLEEP